MNELMSITPSEETKPIFCSAAMDTAEEKAKWFAATNAPDKKVADCINETISVKDLYIEFVDCMNQETGELSENVPRIILMDDKGVSYAATSFVLFNALKRLINFYGMPNQWEKPLKIKFKQINKGAKRLLTLDVVA